MIVVRQEYGVAGCVSVAIDVGWINHRRLHGEIGLVPPAEHEDNFYRQNTAATIVAASVPGLH